MEHFIDFHFLTKKIKVLDCFLEFVTSYSVEIGKINI